MKGTKRLFTMSPELAEGEKHQLQVERLEILSF